MNRLQTLFVDTLLIPTRVTETKVDARGLSSSHFDWVMTFGNIWLITGSYLDLWAHTHGRADGSFFTIWHGVLYSGFLAIVLGMMWEGFGNLLRNRTWRGALPRGYALPLVGAVLFGIGGVGDLIWHTLFGIEKNMEGAISPTHLLLIIAGVMLFSGPLLAAWQRPGRVHELQELLPALIAVACIVSLGILQFHDIVPIGFPRAVQGTLENSSILKNFNQELGVVGIILYTVILMSVILLLISRWTLPFGSLTLIMTFNMIEMGWAKDQYRLIPAVFLAGLLADILYQSLKPSSQRVNALRLFAFAVPVVYFTLYFMTLALTDTIWWRIHLWGGCIFIAGLIGLVLSFVAVPPALPLAEEIK